MGVKITQCTFNDELDTIRLENVNDTSLTSYHLHYTLVYAFTVTNTYHVCFIMDEM